MKFESVSGKKRSRRSKSSLQAPAAVESLEVRSLMTVLSPTGTVNDATPTITWEAVDNAISYDLWVTDAEQRMAQFVEYNIEATNFTPVNDLNLGRTRTWVRANFADAPSSKWSAPKEFIVQVVPTVTGPVNPSPSAPPKKLAETRPTITWTSPPGAFRFEIFLSNQTDLTSRLIPVANYVPIPGDDGNPQPDGKGDVLRKDVRSHTLPDDLVMGNYRVFVRSVDDGGRTSAWSAAYDFEVAPSVGSQLVELDISGTPTAGSYSIEITTTGATGQTFKTAALPYNATTEQVQAAVRSLKGFETTEVTTTGTSPNFSHRLRLPVSVGRVTASVVRSQFFELEISGTPTAGSYSIEITTTGATGQTFITAALPYNATTEQVQAAVRSLKGFETTEVTTTGTSPNFAHRLSLPVSVGRVTASVAETVSPGTVSAAETASPGTVSANAVMDIIRPVGGTFQSSHVIALNISGTPAAGSYSIAITTLGAAGRTFRTAMLPYNATNADVQAAVRSLKGFETTEVTTTGSSPNLAHRLHLPVSVGKVTASVAETVSPGTVIASVINAPGILLQWEPVEGATHYEVWVSKQGAENEKTTIHSARYLTTTSYQIPALLADGDYVFWVRARRLHQVTEIKLTGNATSGSYRIVLTTFGKNGTTQQTGPISYNATAANIKAAVVSLKGFENVDVVAGASNTQNLTYLLQIPQTSGQVNVNVVGSITPGQLTHTTRYQPEVVGHWSMRNDFSTIPIPVITGPAGIETDGPNKKIVTDARPIVEWMLIDNAARYDVWIERANGKSPYLLTSSSVNFYQFEQDIEPGKYTVWVRAVSITGKLANWSEAFSFEATGGVPVITSPVPNSSVLPIPDITWTPVSDAKSYDIWIAWVGEDYDYIRTSDITQTTYSPTDPLPTGSYRVWVRAIKADGTALPWSTPVNFTVALNDVEQSAGEVPELLAALLPTTGDVRADSGAEAAARESMDRGASDVPVESDRVPFESIAMMPMPAVISEMTPETEGLIQQLAEECMSAEWWMPQATKS